MYTIKSYVFPESLAEADELLQRDVRNTAVLGGCCWLKLGRRRISRAIDLTRLGLDQIEVKDGWLELGACVTLRQSHWSISAKAYSPSLTSTSAMISSFRPINVILHLLSSNSGISSRFGSSKLSSGRSSSEEVS